MSIEAEISALSSAIDRARVVGNLAVAEIIRQRDEAYKEAIRYKESADFFCARRDELYKNLLTERKRVAALRGVIARMRKAASK